MHKRIWTQESKIVKHFIKIYSQMLIYCIGLAPVLAPQCVAKEDTCIETQQRAKNIVLVITSSLLEGIFVGANGVNCTSLEIFRAIKYFTQLF